MVDVVSYASASTTPGTNASINGTSILGTGLVSMADDSFRNSMALAAKFYSDLGGTGTVGGTANAITLTTPTLYAALTNGQVEAFKNTNGPNTGAVTLNLDANGAKAVRLQGDIALVGGEMQANGVYLLRYDTAYNSAAGAWVLLNQDDRTAVRVIRTQVFTSSGTYTPNANMVYCIIEAVGGGGGGGSAAVSGSNQFSSAGGGGSGGYSRRVASAAQIGSSQTVTVGAAGTGAAAGNNSGGAGGNTSLGTLCIANGGSGGGGAAAGAVGAGGAGGSASAGNLNLGGGIGFPGTLSSLSVGGITITGAPGGASLFGAGGYGGVNGQPGGNGNGLGSGGGASSSSSGGSAGVGGTGALGCVYITEFCSA